MWYKEWMILLKGKNILKLPRGAQVFNGFKESQSCTNPKMGTCVLASYTIRPNHFTAARPRTISHDMSKRDDTVRKNNMPKKKKKDDYSLDSHSEPSDKISTNQEFNDQEGVTSRNDITA